jgi:hypothetical protein
MMKRLAAALAMLLALGGSASAQICGALPFVFSNGTLADATQVNADFNALLNCANNLLAPIASPTFTGTLTSNGPSVFESTTTFNAVMDLANNVAFQGQNVAGNAYYQLAYVNPSNELIFGDAMTVAPSTGVVSFNSNILPGSGDGTGNVGQIDQRWGNIYTYTLNFNNGTHGMGISATGVGDNPMTFQHDSNTIMTLGTTGVLTLTAAPVFASSATGAATQTFTNAPCATSLTTEQWVPVSITGQTGTWYVPACH